MKLGQVLLRNSVEVPLRIFGVVLGGTVSILVFLIICIYAMKKTVTKNEVRHSTGRISTNHRTRRSSPRSGTIQDGTREIAGQNDSSSRFRRLPSAVSAAQAPIEPPDAYQADEERRTAVNRLVDTLPMFLAGPSYATDRCPICLDTMEDTPISIGMCMHAAHTECLSSYLVKTMHELCPVCRSPLLMT